MTAHRAPALAARIVTIVKEENNTPMTSNSTTDADLAAATAAQLNLYGQRAQPEETPDFLSKSHAKLLKELDKLDEDTKNGWLQAKVKCPNLVGEEHRLMFLRCEVFNEEVSDCYIYPICIVNRIYYDVDSPVSHALMHFYIHDNLFISFIDNSWQQKGFASIGT